MRWLTTAALGTFCLQAGAVDKPDLQLSDFIHTVWTQRDGIPQKVFAVAQAEDGWLWLGGPNGLYQFDGIKAQKVRADRGTRRLSVSVLYATPSGELVVGMVGGGISVYDHGRFRHYDDARTLRAGRVQNFTRDADGVLWAMCDDGVLRFEGQQWAQVGEDWNYSGEGAYASVLDRRGTLWIANRGGVWKLPKGAKKLELTDVRANAIETVVQSADGLTWAMEKETARLLPDQEPGAIDAAEGRRMSGYTMFDTDGYYWASTRLKNFPYPVVRWLDTSGFHTTTGIEDRQRNVWIGSIDGQLHRFRRPRLTRLPAPELPAESMPAAIVPDSDRKIWISFKGASAIGSPSEGAWVFDKTLRRVQQETLRSGGPMARDPSGVIWYTNDRTIWRLTGDRFVPAVAFPERWDGDAPTALAAGCAGGVWFASPRMGLWRHDGSSWQRNGAIAALPDEAPTRLLCDSRRRLWLGYRDGTLMQVDGDRIDRMAPPDSLAVGSVVDISVGPQVLVVGEQGLALAVAGRFETLHAALPSAFEGLTGVAQASNGDVWLNGPNGMGRVRASDLPTQANGVDRPVPMQLFDVSDGYPGPGGFTHPRLSPDIVVDDTDRVWVSGQEGIAYLDANAARLEKEASQVFIRAVSANDEPREAADTLGLPQGTRTLRFDYTALDYTHPERLRFRHRLEGIDSDWIVDEDRREGNYANMGPGTYRFVVEASDERGAWSAAPASMTLTIAPTFWQSWYFIALCLLASAALVAVAHRLRLRQVAGRQKRLLDERLYERERIARELHDTLLQGNQTLILKMHALSSALPAGGVLRQRLGDAVEVAQQAMNEARDRIQALRSEFGSPDDFEGALTAIGSTMVQGTNIVFTAGVQRTPRALAIAVAEAVHLIVQEALRNAVRHADPQAIELQILYADRGLRVVVRDDGRGIDGSKLLEGAKPRHWGLKGMEERAREVGGELVLRTGSDAGTEVEVRIPASAAYRQPRAA